MNDLKFGNTESDGDDENDPVENDDSLVFSTALYPLFDALSKPWPRFLVSLGMFLELVQMLALILNHVYPWGSVLSVISVPIYFTILPIWDANYVVHLGYTESTIFSWMSFVVAVAVVVVVVYQRKVLQKRRIRQTSLLVRLFLFLVVGPFFLPLLHHLLSVSVCFVPTSDSELRNYLAAFPSHKCFTGAPYETTVFSIAVVSLVLLVFAKLVITMMVYDDHPLSMAPRARTHNIVEGWFFVFQVISAVLFHYLPAVGQRETFSGLFVGSTFILMVLHAFYLPFINFSSNRLRVMFLACSFYCAVVATIVLGLTDRTVLYGGSNWDFLVCVAGCAIAAIASHRLATVRISFHFQRDIARAKQGHTDTEKQRVRMRFPWYLPMDERTSYTEDKVFATAPSDLLTRGLVNPKGSSHCRNSHSFTDWESCQLDELGSFTMACYIDAVYVVTDVELASRFAGELCRATSTMPSQLIVGFASRIFAKGLNRFPQNDWLKLQYATFLFTFVNEQNPLALSILDSLCRRQQDTLLSYRLHRHVRQTRTSFRETTQSKKALAAALSHHRESLISVNNFWKRLAADQIDVTQLGEVAYTIVVSCHGGLRNYTQALSHHVDIFTLTRYAQFLDYVVLDSESAQSMREMAVDCVERQKAGLVRPEVSIRSGESDNALAGAYSGLSRTLRVTLGVLGSLVFVILVVLLAVIIFTYNSDIRIITQIHKAMLCRTYTLRTLWSTQVALANGEWDETWVYVQQDLTQLRAANADITYKDTGKMHWLTIAIMQMPLFTYFYGIAGLYENVGAWQAGNFYISTLESIILKGTTTSVRTAKYNMLLLNDLTGAASGYNQTLHSYSAEASKALNHSALAAFILYSVGVCVVLFIFFVFRCFLSRISGSRLSALGLFRLIPQTALSEMITKMDHRIETFDAQDLVFLDMLQARGLVDAPDTETSPDLDPYREDCLTTSPIISSLQNPKQVSLAADRTRPPREAEDGETHASRFESLLKNSTVADVGRLKVGQGQYEAPHPKGAFLARTVTSEEALARQKVIDDAEVEESLMKFQRGVRVEVENEKVVDDIRRMDHAISNITVVATTRQRIGHLFLGLCCVVFAILTAVFMVHRYSINGRATTENINSTFMLQRAQSTLTNALDAAERMVYDTSEAAMNELEKKLPQLRLIEFEVMGVSDESLSTSYASQIARYDVFNQRARKQALVAAYLACLATLSIDADSLTTTTCDPLSYLDWTADDFIPSPSDHFLYHPAALLPEGKKEDIKRSPEDMMSMARNIVASNFYQYLRDTMGSYLVQSEKEILSDISHEVDSLKEVGGWYANVALAMAIMLLLASVLHMTQGYVRFPRMHFLHCLNFLLLLAAVAVMVCVGIVHRRDIPQATPYTTMVSHARSVQDVYELTYISRKHCKLAAFAGVMLGAVEYNPNESAALSSAWSTLLELIGDYHLSQLTGIFADYHYAHYLDSIVVVLGCSYQKFPEEIASLPTIAGIDWNITGESFGFRRQQTYLGTDQLLYTTREQDLALPVEDQRALAASLAFGTLHTTVFHRSFEGLMGILQQFMNEQLGLTDREVWKQKPLIFAVVGLCACIVLVNIALLLVLSFQFMQEHSVRVGLRTTAGSSVNTNGIQDRSFRAIMTRTALVIVLFLTLFTVLFALLMHSYMESNTGDDSLRAAAAPNTELLHSAIDFQHSTTSGWLIESAYSLSNWAVQLLEAYYKISYDYFRKPVLQSLFGPMSIERNRYDASTAINTESELIIDDSPVLSFDGLVDLSLRRWFRRMLYLRMAYQNRLKVEESSYKDLYVLSDNGEAAIVLMRNSIERKIKMWFAVNFTVWCVIFVLYLGMMWHFMIPVVRRLMKEEEGTQVMLRMIPPDVRLSVPAIAEYMATGRIVQDANIGEVDSAAKEFSIQPTITINSRGIILDMSRAAEEAFLWTKSEAVGRNVCILMPDNIAEEHDHYIKRYIETGVQTVINNSRLFRAKRKDGTFFPVIIQVQELRLGSNLHFIAVIRNCEEDMELERAYNLSMNITDAFTTAIFVTDTSGVIVRFSKSAQTTFRCAEQDVVGHKMGIIMSRFDAEMHDQIIEKYLHTNQKITMDNTTFIRAKRLNGELFPAYMMLREYKNAGAHYYIGYLEDMTARLHLEMIAAAGNTTKVKSPTPLIIANSDGLIVFTSESACRIFGFSEEELLRQPLSILMEEPLASQHQAFYSTYMRQSNSTRRAFTAGEPRVVMGPARRREDDGTMSTFLARVTLKGFTSQSTGENVFAMIEDISKKQTMQVRSKIGSAIVSQCPTPIIIVSDSGCVTQMNPAAEEMFHILSASAYGKSVYMLFNHDTNPPSTASDRNPIETVIEEYKKTGTSNRLGRNLPCLVRAMDDRDVSFTVDVMVKEVLQEGSTYFIVHARDNSHDLRLLEASRWGDALMEISMVPIVCASLDGVIFSCSDSTCRQFGWAREELIFKNISMLLPNFSASESGLSEGAGLQHVFHRELFITGRTRSGEQFPVALFLKGITIEGSEPFLVAALRNYTAEVGLAEQKRVDRIMADISPIPFVCITSSGIITEFSRLAEEHFGYSSLEVLGHNVRMLMPEEIALRHDGYLRSYEKTGVKRVVDCEMGYLTTGRHKSGFQFPILLFVKEVRRGSTVEFVSYIRDLSERYALEQAAEANLVLQKIAAIPMLEVSMSGTIIRANKHVYEEFGIPQTENLEGQSIFDLVPDLAVEENGEVINQAKWLQKGIAALESASLQQKDPLSAVDHCSTLKLSRRAKSLFSAEDGNALPPISKSVQELYGRRRNGDCFSCEVSLAEVISIPHAEATTVWERRLVVYARSLTSDFQLRHQNDVNSALLAISPAPVLIFDEHGILVHVSTVAEELLGYFSSEVVGKNFVMLLEPMQAALYQRAFIKVGEKPMSVFSNHKEPVRFKMLRKGLVCIEVDAYIKEVLSDGPSVYVCYLRDLSTVMAMEAETAIHDFLTRGPLLAVLVTDHNGILVECSEAAAKLLHLRQVEMIGKSIDFLRARPIALGEVVENSMPLGSASDGGDFFSVNMQFREGQPKLVEDRVWVRGGDGTVLSAHVSIQAVLPYRTQFPRFVAYIRSLEQNMANAPQLKEANRILEATPSAVLVLNLHGLVLRCNAVAAALLRYKSVDILNQPVTNFLSPGKADYLLSKLFIQRESGVALGWQTSSESTSALIRTIPSSSDGSSSSKSRIITLDGLPLLRRDRQEITVNATLTFVPSTDGEGSHGVLNFTDVSENIHTQAHLAKERAVERQEGICAIELDVTGNFIHVSELFAEVIGGTVEDFLGHPYTTFTPKGTRVVAEFTQTAQATLRSGGTMSSQHTVFLFKSHHGTAVRMVGEMHPVLKPDGTLSSVFVELVLPRPMESDTSLVELSTLSLASEAVAVVSRHGMILCCNEAAASLFQVPEGSTLVGSSLSRLFPAVGVTELIAQHATSQKPWNTAALSYPNRLPPGSVTPDAMADAERHCFRVSVNISQIANPTDSRLASAGPATARGAMYLLCLQSVEREFEIAKWKRAIDAALDFSFHATIVMNVAGHIEVFSKVSERLFGVPAATAHNREMAELLLHPEEAAKVRQAFAVFRRTGQADVLEAQRQVKANYYGESPSAGELGPIVGMVDVELVIHQLQLSSRKSQYEYVAFLITKQNSAR